MDAWKVTLAALLHDIGKLVYRSGSDSRAHPVSGAEFLKAFCQDEELLACVRYHHKQDLNSANLEKDSPAYLVYVADNIAAAVDRRLVEGEDDSFKGYDKNLPLASVFNILNGGNRDYAFPLKPLDSTVNFPRRAVTNSPGEYMALLQGFKQGLGAVEFTLDYVNSLLELSQAYLSFVPSSTDKNEVADISLYDHQKITAAAASCIEAYLKQAGRTDYRRELLVGEKDFDEENAFLMFTCDISGIQKFTYTIASKDAAKMLRSRSFYLEILMESFIDDILFELGLSRANLIYSGGGHCYMLLPNTAPVKEKLDEAISSLNARLFKEFKTLLFMASACTECSAKELKGNEASGASGLSQVFARLSVTVASHKLKRYGPEEIRALNQAGQELKERECISCGAVDALTDSENRCKTCRDLIDISPDLMVEGSCFVISEKAPTVKHIQLPAAFGKSRFLSTATKETAKRLTLEDDGIVRIYGKNEFHTGLKYSSKLWMGLYAARDERGGVLTFEKMAEASQGIKRLGVLRADVDDLGAAFIAGFVRQGENPYVYETLSRKASLSGQLSLFFKKHLNILLEGGAGIEYFSLDGKETKREKSLMIIYSGGDDLFIVGAWNEVIEAAVDLKRAFELFTGGALSFSAGIGLYEKSYPISRMADETEALQGRAKRIDENKNALSLFGPEYVKGELKDNHTYKWDYFIDNVVGEKLRTLQNYTAALSGEERAKGNSFLYKLKDYAQGVGEDKINLARAAYLLGRMSPRSGSKEAKQAYDDFTAKLMLWLNNPEERKAFLTALTLFVYLNR